MFIGTPTFLALTVIMLVALVIWLALQVTTLASRQKHDRILTEILRGQLDYHNDALKEQFNTNTTQFIALQKIQKRLMTVETRTDDLYHELGITPIDEVPLF